MSYDGMLNKTCTIQKCTYTQNETTGEMNESWANYATNVPCRLNTFQQGRNDKNDDVIYIVRYKLFLIYRIDLNWKEYRIIINSDIYTIISVEDAGGQGHHTELVLELVK